MVKFASVSSFRKRLETLLKVRRGIYNGVQDEICHAFQGATIEQIRENRDMILLSNDAVVIKLRMPDRKSHLSKSDGYRLIYMAMKQVPLAVMLDVYPKRGPMQQLDIDDKEVNRLIMEFISEESANMLVFHDIDNHFKEMSL